MEHVLFEVSIWGQQANLFRGRVESANAVGAVVDVLSRHAERLAGESQALKHFTVLCRLSDEEGGPVEKLNGNAPPVVMDPTKIPPGNWQRSLKL